MIEPTHIINVLLWAMVVLVFLQATPARVVAAAIFVGVALTHELLFLFYGNPTYDAHFYYFSAMVFGYIVLKLMGKMAYITRTAVRLHLVALASIFVNAAAWILMMAEFEPLEIYAWAIVALFTWVIFILITGSRLRGGDTTMDQRTVRYPHYPAQSRFVTSRFSRKA